MTARSLQNFRSAWRKNWQLSRRRAEPLWVRLALTALLGGAIGLLITLAGLPYANEAMLGHWPRMLARNLIVSLSIGFTISAAYRGLELSLPEALLQRLNADRGWRAVLLHAGLAILCTLVGGVIGVTLIGWLLNQDAWGFVTRRPGTITEFLTLSLVITAVVSLVWQWRLRRRERQLRATEAQLKLLQAQIEPHFLFNTLANVHSLMDVDAARAKLMLESFTDYLRASLSQLRSGDATLASELAMAESYLSLMQTRMAERLVFQLHADAAARQALLPPLLLQPLIENAIHHGLEPKLEGGTVTLDAHLTEGRLEIRVGDDGLGLDAAAGAALRRPHRAGSGIALANIRARLEARYGRAAALRLEHASGGGTIAILTLPYMPSDTPCPPSAP
ncbi:MAG TPA: histidine kinase [Roseateles sp.]|nr:histidine kinase [Roseateles sp.]